MADFGNKNTSTPKEILALEAEADARLAASLAESQHRLAPACPECKAIGSLEEHDGVMRCIYCDEIVAQTTRLPGMGR
jgi:ribosomal protein L37AE/L43A